MFKSKPAGGGIPQAGVVLRLTVEIIEQPPARAEPQPPVETDSARCIECVHVLADGKPAWWGAFQQLLARNPGLGIEGDLPALCRCEARGVYRWLQRRSRG